MKKTIKTADILAYLTAEIEVYEATAEKYARELCAIDNGEYKGHRPIEQEKKRLEAHTLYMEHQIDALGRVKRHIYYVLAKESDKE